MRDTRKLRIFCSVVAACWTIPQAVYCVLCFDPWLAPGLVTHAATPFLLASYTLLAVLTLVVLVPCGMSLAEDRGGWRWLVGWALMLAIGFAYQVFALFGLAIFAARLYDPAHRPWILLGAAVGFVAVALALVATLIDSPSGVLAASRAGLARSLRTTLGRVAVAGTVIAVLVMAALVTAGLRAGLARPGTSVPGNGAAVVAVAFSPDGRSLAVADDTGDVTIAAIDPATGAPAAGARPYVIPGASASPNAIAFNSSGHALAIGGANGDGDGEVALWDTVTRQRLFALADPVPRAPIRSLAFMADGRVLAAGDTSGVTCLWDARTGRLLARLGTAQPVTSQVGADNTGIDALAFSPDGSLLATVRYSGGVTLWRTATGTETGTTLVPPTTQASLNGSDAVTFRDGDEYTIEIGVGRRGVYLWDASTGRLRTIVTWSAPQSFDFPIALSGNGNSALVGGATVQLWDLSYSGVAEAWRDPAGYPIASVALSPDGPVAFGDDDGGPGTDVTFPSAAYLRYPRAY
jgi:hypothetical protein